MKKLLEDLNACNEAKDWIENKSIDEAVASCHRGDWLLWLADKINIDKRKLTLAKGYCANTVRHLMNDDRSIAAVDAAIKYGNGEISEDELNFAAASTAAAYFADAASASAAYAAGADAGAAGAAYAAGAAAAASAAAAAYFGAKIKNQKITADICRQYIGDEIIKKVNEILNTTT